MNVTPEQVGLTVVNHGDYFELTNDARSISIVTKKYILGMNLFIGDRVKFCNHNGGPMDSIIFGDNVQVHHDSTFMVPSLSILDYTKINNNFYVYGTHELSVGYNCWIGSRVVLDTLGGLQVGNNVCIATASQVYSHAKFGDTLFGCNINSTKHIMLGNDVWIAPNSVITMATMASKSMLLAGGVLTTDTVENHIYAGVPARDISDKIGMQFNEVDFVEVCINLKKYLADFYLSNPTFNQKLIEVSVKKPLVFKKNVTYFIISDRRYTKKLSEVEICFIKYLLPDKGKFIPYNDLLL